MRGRRIGANTRSWSGDAGGTAKTQAQNLRVIGLLAFPVSLLLWITGFWDVALATPWAWFGSAAGQLWVMHLRGWGEAAAAEAGPYPIGRDGAWHLSDNVTLLYCKKPRFPMSWGFHWMYSVDALELSVPCWLVSVALSVPLWYPALPSERRRRRRERGLCAECGYDLRASLVRCPECGTPVGLAVRHEVRKERRRTGD